MIGRTLARAALADRSRRSCVYRYNAFIGFQSKHILSRHPSSVKSIGFAVINVGAALGNLCGPSIVGAVANSLSFSAAFFVISSSSVCSLAAMAVLARMQRGRVRLRLMDDGGEEEAAAAPPGSVQLAES